MKQPQDDRQFELVLFSFGFKYGLPTDATMLLDVRFLPNPYWEEGMRHLTGHDAGVAAYVLESESGRELFSRLVPLLTFLLEHNRKAGKAAMRIGIGCTGGHHRSVAVVERLGRLLPIADLQFSIEHRDIGKE